MKRAADEKLNNDLNAKRLKMGNGSAFAQMSPKDIKMEVWDIDTEPLSPPLCTLSSISDESISDKPTTPLACINGKVVNNSESTKATNDVPPNSPAKEKSSIVTASETMNGIIETHKEKVIEVVNLDDTSSSVIEVSQDVTQEDDRSVQSLNISELSKLDDDSSICSITIKQEESMIIDKVGIKEELSQNLLFGGKIIPSLPPIIMISGFTRLYKEKVSLFTKLLFNPGWFFWSYFVILHLCCCFF
jgi:hypothetical protein